MNMYWLVFVVCAFLPNALLMQSSKLKELHENLGHLRLGTVKDTCHYFCSYADGDDDDDTDFLEFTYEALFEARIFCELCEKKYPTTTVQPTTQASNTTESSTTTTTTTTTTSTTSAPTTKKSE